MDLTARFDFVHLRDGFYIVGYGRIPLEQNAMKATDAHVFGETVRLLLSFLDRDGDGQIDRLPLLNSLGQNFVFAMGYEPQLRPYEDNIDRRFGRYALPMNTDGPIEQTLMATGQLTELIHMASRGLQCPVKGDV